MAGAVGCGWGSASAARLSGQRSCAEGQPSRPRSPWRGAAKSVKGGSSGSPGQPQHGEVESPAGKLPRWRREIRPGPGLRAAGGLGGGFGTQRESGGTVPSAFGGDGGRSLQGRALRGWPRMALGTGTVCPACLPAFLAQCCLRQPSPCLVPGRFPAARGVPVVVPPRHSRCGCTCPRDKPSPGWQGWGRWRRWGASPGSSGGGEEGGLAGR